MDEQSLKYFVFASIISADNDEFTEEVKQEILSRYNPDEKWEDHDWEYILEPIGDKVKIDRLVSVLESRAKLDPHDDPVVATRNDGTNVRASEL